jgi:hypothetical protein
MTFAYLILLYVGTEFAGGSGAISVLSAGIVVANLAYLPHFLAGSNIVDVVRYQLFSMESTHSELTLLIRIFFFVEVGLVLNISDVNILIMSIILSILLLLVRYPIAYGAVKSLGMRRKTGIAAAISTVFYGRGLAAAVMAVWAAQQVYIPGNVATLLIGVASAVVLLTNVILTVGVVALKNKVRELLI